MRWLRPDVSERYAEIVLEHVRQYAPLGVSTMELLDRLEHMGLTAEAAWDQLRAWETQGEIVSQEGRWRAPHGAPPREGTA